MAASSGRKTTAAKRAGKAPARKRRSTSPRRWSQRVTEQSDALDLKKGVFAQGDHKKIAASLKRSAQARKRLKADPSRSALSMLTFYINRAGKQLPARRKRTLEKAKDELRAQFGRG